MITYYKIQCRIGTCWEDTQNVYQSQQEAQDACDYLECQNPLEQAFFRIVQVQEIPLEELRHYKIILN